jgi:UDP-2,4-diacetamido-2,4,6-trideoxy-beta-L-altropyranose hydrolase
MAGPTILFIADAGPEVGGGHVMRSLTLARALETEDARCVFLSSPAAAKVLTAFAPDIEQREAPGAFDAVVFDHYGLGRSEHLGLAGRRPALVIDDLANRPLGADLVLDSGPSRTESDYVGLVPAGARLLLGPDYAPVRPQFGALRAEALARRSGPPRRALVSMGLTDVGGITLRVLKALTAQLAGLQVDVVMGAGADGLPAVRALTDANAETTLHVDSADMAELMVQADVGIGGGGSTTWERCTLGLPSIQVVLAENQRPAAAAIAERGAALVVDAGPGFETDLERAFGALMSDAERRTALAKASAEICDGLGAGRVAHAFLERLGA